jgi:DNA-binding transcriptional LysR family regulator
MALTAFGRRMLPDVRAALDQLAALQAVAGEAAGVLSGTVHVGVLPSLAPQLLPLLFSEIRRTAPGVSLRATEGFSGSLDEQLAGGRLDIAVINRYGPSAGRGEELLGHADTYLVGKPGGPLLREETVAFKALLGVPLVLPMVPNGLRLTLDQLCRRHALHLDIVMEVDSSASMKDVARSGHAFTLLPLMAVQEEIALRYLAASRVVKPGIARTVVLATTTQRPLSRAARHVASCVRKLAPRLIK